MEVKELRLFLLNTPSRAVNLFALGIEAPLGLCGKKCGVAIGAKNPQYFGLFLDVPRIVSYI
jgi:hypothetical protein